MNNEIQAMNDAVNTATPDEIFGKVKMIVTILAGLLDKLNGKLTIWTILFNATLIVDAIKGIIQVIKSKPIQNA